MSIIDYLKFKFYGTELYVRSMMYYYEWQGFGGSVEWDMGLNVYPIIKKKSKLKLLYFYYKTFSELYL